MSLRTVATACFAAIALGGAAFAAEPAPEPPAWPEAIQDNSFLIEEAYNQEPGVVQWIFGFQYVRGSRNWQNTFTSEWPVPDERNQLSVTVPFSTKPNDGGADGVGDVLLNYRRQLLGGSERGWWFAPRLSAVLPTGDWRGGTGNGAWGAQVNLPWSRRLSADFAAHLNVGGTWIPRARFVDDAGRPFRAESSNVSAGASLIWHTTPVFNLLLEVVGVRVRTPIAPGVTESTNQLIVSPGMRRAFNFKSGQLVLGAALPIGATKDSPDPGVFLYVSWEAPVWKSRAAKR